MGIDKMGYDMVFSITKKHEHKPSSEKINEMSHTELVWGFREALKRLASCKNCLPVVRESLTTKERGKLAIRIIDDIEYLDARYVWSRLKDYESIDYEAGVLDLTLGDLKQILDIVRESIFMKDAVDAMSDLVEAIPSQSNDHDWWPDELTHAVERAKIFINRYE